MVLTKHNAGPFSFIHAKICPLPSSSSVPAPPGTAGTVNIRVVVLKNIELWGLSPILVPEENYIISGFF